MSKAGTGATILVVEDEALIAIDVETTLRQAGFEVAGPFSRLAEAEHAAEAMTLDGAVLDVNLQGEPAFSIADALARRRIPFLFLTSYGRDALPERFRHRPIARKPCPARSLLRALNGTVAR